MALILLVHWNAKEAEDRAAALRRARHEVVVLSTPASDDLRGGRLWLAWPKKASGIPTDLAQDDVRAFGLAAGWVDYKIAALDATWSGLCFARRRDRPQGAGARSPRA